MSTWIASIEAKARLIHEQIAAVRNLAASNGAKDADAFVAPYLELLRRLYDEEFPLANLADSSDLVARYAGPAVEDRDPTVSIVLSVFSGLRNEIRGIAKSIVGLADSQQARWPETLDPHLSGVARGSLVVGIKVPSPKEISTATSQMELNNVSDQVYLSVRAAVRHLSTVARFVRDDRIDDEIREELPDPAVRDAVMVAARRLSPTGRRGIASVSLLGGDGNRLPYSPLTPRSRRVLGQALARPVRVAGSGEFEGTVREIDLDANRFEIRGVEGVGAIRCIYSSVLAKTVRTILDHRISVSGSYETLANQKPRLVDVESISILAHPLEQLHLGSTIKGMETLPAPDKK